MDGRTTYDSNTSLARASRDKNVSCFLPSPKTPVTCHTPEFRPDHGVTLPSSDQTMGPGLPDPIAKSVTLTAYLLQV